MAKRQPNIRRAAPTASTRIPILSLSSGVSTQAPSKRLPLEAQDMTNALVSLERSFEKRPGFSILPSSTWDGSSTNGVLDADSTNRLDLWRCLEKTTDDSNKDFWWYWFTINDNNRFLIGIDYKASATNAILFYVYKINENNYTDITPTSAAGQQNTSIVSQTTRNYITYGSDLGYNARDVLKATTVGSSIVVLNTLVKAGFTSSDNGVLFGLDGKEPASGAIQDPKGKKVTYYTSSRVAGTTGSLESSTESSTSTTSLTVNSIDPFTLATIIPNTAIVNQTVALYNNTTANSATNSQYFTGILTNIYNSDVTTLGFTNTPTDYKKTVSTSIIGSTSLIDTSIALTATVPADVQVGSYVVVYKDSDTYFTGTITTKTSTTACTIKILYASPASKALTVTSVGWSIGYECATVDINFISQPLIDTTTTAIANWKILYSTFVPVEDFVYKDSTSPWLGQSFADFSEIRFPPEATEVYGNNGNYIGLYNIDTTAATMLDSLYDPSHPLDTLSPLAGRGKIYFTAGPYLSQSSGYYRVVNFPDSISYKDGATKISGTGRPYTQKIRSPDMYSVLDERRLPQKLIFNELPDGINSDWSFQPINWTPKTTGTRYSNPGPSVFLSSDQRTAKQVNINAIATFRDRLYLASEDVIFSSQLGSYEDFFLADPSNIVSSDPIDIRASSNTYAEISSITPFSDFLFINTKGDIQFELRGSENQITPLTAQIAPTAFYSTAKLTEPILMGSLIYFFDKRRLYIYMPQQNQSISLAQEISSHCGDYLPTNFRATCSCPAQNTIVAVDDDSPNNIYLYTTRFSGDRVLQNAFYKYTIEADAAVESCQVYDNYLHTVVKKKSTIQDDAVEYYEYYIQKTYLQKQGIKLPRLDNLIKIQIQENSNCSYNPASNETSFYLNYRYTIKDNDKLYLITDPEDTKWGQDAYTIFKPIIVKGGGKYILKVSGDYSEHGANIYIGTSFNMNVELSTQFVRDQNNNAIDGVLNLRTLLSRHIDTGNYDVIATRRNKSILKSSFTALTTDSNNDVLSLENTQTSGEFVSKIFGFSDTTKIQIVSDYPTPVNIVNLEFKGKFTQTYSSLNT